MELGLKKYSLLLGFYLINYQMQSIDKKSFLQNEVIPILKNLKSDTQPAFGIMTPQHMVEHLVWTVKTMMKRSGEPAAEPTKGALGFRKFLDNGAIVKHYPSDKTAADLPPLRYDSLEAAIAEIPLALDRFYTFFDANPDFKSYHPRMGELSFEDLELFHFQHYRYHLGQFGVLVKPN